MRRIIMRDQKALVELYQHYGSPVFSLSLRVLRNRSLAEEITQDVFMHVWDEPQTWDYRKGHLLSWLLTITRYKSIDRLRKEFRRPMLQARSLLEVEDKHSATNDMDWEDGRLLRSLMDELPEEQLRTIKLAYFRGMSHSEIAEHLRLPLGTVKSRIRLGLQRLKDLWLAAVDLPKDE